MGWLSDFLFGRKPELKVSEHSTLTPEQEQLLRDLIGQVSGQTNLFNRYGGSMTGEKLPQNYDSLSALEQIALARAGGQGGTDYGTAFGTLKSAQDTPFDAAEASRMFDQSIADPAIKEFRERIMPEITARFKGNAAFGSDRIEAERRAAGDLSSSLAGTRAKTLYEARDRSKDRALTAAGLTATLGGAQRADQDSISAMLQAVLSGRVGIDQFNVGVGERGIDRSMGENARMDQGRLAAIEAMLAALGIKGKENIAAGLPGSNGLVQQAVSSFFGNLGGRKI